MRRGTYDSHGVYRGVNSPLHPHRAMKLCSEIPPPQPNWKYVANCSFEITFLKWLENKFSYHFVVTRNGLSRIRKSWKNCLWHTSQLSGVNIHRCIPIFFWYIIISRRLFLSFSIPDPLVVTYKILFRYHFSAICNSVLYFHLHFMKCQIYKITN